MGGSVIGLSLASAFLAGERGLAQSAADTTRLTVRPREMATGTRTERAGEQWLDSVAGRVYVPQQCVGTRRCPLVIAAFHVWAPRRWHREQAEAHGMIYLEPCGAGFDDYGGQCFASVTGMDSALKRVLRTFAIDPDKIALWTERLDGWFVRGGGHVPEVFSRAAELWWPDVSDTLVPVGPQATATQQFRVIVGVNEINKWPAFATAFKNAQTLHRAGYPVAYTGTLRDHKNCREDFEDVWQWFADSWAAPTPAAAAPLRASADSMPRLTEESFIRLLAFWQRFREEKGQAAYGDRGPYTWGWDSTYATVTTFQEGPPVPTRVHRKALTVPFGPGQQPMQILIADMPALAAADPAIAADLTAVGLTASQEEADRIAFIRALVTGALAGQGLVQVDSTSVLGQNIEFVNAHDKRGGQEPTKVEQLQHKLAECHAG